MEIVNGEMWSGVEDRFVCDGGGRHHFEGSLKKGNLDYKGQSREQSGSTRTRIKGRRSPRRGYRDGK